METLIRVDKRKQKKGYSSIISLVDPLPLRTTSASAIFLLVIVFWSWSLDAEDFLLPGEIVGW